MNKVKFHELKEVQHNVMLSGVSSMETKYRILNLYGLDCAMNL